jgi:hypothetical protein
MELCEKCLEDAIERTATDDRWGVKLCGSCATSDDEAAYERSMEDYYGGSGPVTMQEHYDAAAKQKREQR